MITKDNKLYLDGLFAKATKLLKDSQDEKTKTFIENNPIRCIDDYFTSLSFIKEELQNQSIDDISYFMLPIEEPLFEINANTRQITVPEEFKNGISVQGDEIAETIFFSIDRYYDTTDFYSDYIIPVVQWKYAKDTGINAYHLSATTGKIVMEDLNSKTGSIKVVFGWPITSDVTERAENIQFSVRFCTIFDEDGELITSWGESSKGASELEYSFSTLNALTKINPGFEINLKEFNAQYHNRNHLLWQRMRSSNSADLNLKAILPIIEYFRPEEGSIADLNENNELTIAFKATYPSGTVLSRLGEQVYEIWRIDHEGNEEIVATGIAESNSADIDNEAFGITYFKTTDTSRNTTDKYYQKIEENENEIYVAYNDPQLIDGLFKRAQTYTVNKAGKYKVKVTNNLGPTNKQSKETETFEITLPVPPTVGGVNDKYSYILKYKVDEDNIPTGEIIPITLSLKTVDNDSGIPLKYNWYRAETENGDKILIKKDLNSVDYSVSDPGYYFLEAVNTRNNEEAKTMNSQGIRVTYPAEKPVEVIYRAGSSAWPISPDQLAEKSCAAANTPFIVDPQTIIKTEDGERPLRVDYDANGKPMFKYQWMKEGSSASFGDTDSLHLTINDIGQVYYCKIQSIYNGDISDTFETEHFTVI